MPRYRDKANGRGARDYSEKEPGQRQEAQAMGVSGDLFPQEETQAEKDMDLLELFKHSIRGQDDQYRKGECDVSCRRGRTYSTEKQGK